MVASLEWLKEHIASVADFPREGIVFRDVSGILRDPKAYEATCVALSEFAVARGANVIVGPEARGFYFACPAAVLCKRAFVPVRKANKLPGPIIDRAYELEYGSAHLQVQEGAIKEGDKVLIIDDLLATGGTLDAIRQLVEACNASVVGMACVAELTSLNGCNKLALQPNQWLSLVQYE